MLLANSIALGLVARAANDTSQPGTLIAVSPVSAAVVCGYFVAAVRDIRGS